MKTLNTKLALLAITFFTIATNISCSKNDDPIVTPLPVVLAPLQDPLQGYLNASGFNQVTTLITNIVDGEFGYTFIPLVSGKITAVAVKIPDTNSALRVTIWDKGTGNVLRTETLNIAAANVETIKAIQPLDLVKDKTYLISMNTNDVVSHRKTDLSATVYPFVVGDIKITNFYGPATSGTQQIMPSSFISNAYYGDCSFKLQK